MVTLDLNRPDEIAACRAAVSVYVQTYWRARMDGPAYQAAVSAYQEHRPDLSLDEVHGRTSSAIAMAAEVDPDVFWGKSWRLPPGSFKTG
ncbi:hypothetical protein [Dichotomicrobium thermohalophilum]|uniref:Uncharacterized protein n=1 Tax=Dichotomicrobium thermohalophilum TaxID=933063 RepID=A0A397QB91_9HYPH|nr:hypothetical protein [Dichotomicrobium thermohalophilum]RIA55374.1 hypothetical protein BXY53_0437 [Dichotomicrobium thermohalophilum]